jgi:hypothetical protein
MDKELLVSLTGVIATLVVGYRGIRFSRKEGSHFTILLSLYMLIGVGLRIKLEKRRWTKLFEKE